MEKNYNIGLDIGTNSVGWAVTDDEGNVLKLKGRHLWGVRLFDEAQTAAERRMHRSTARRLDRRKERINLLQELLKDDICKLYPSFYSDLKLSKYHNGDGISNKKINIKRKNKYNIFSDDEFTDLDYYHKYKTIYHLRNALCTSDEKADIRLVYLALHHIIKYRGNFLYDGEFKISETAELKDKLVEILNEYTETGCYTEITIEKVFEILSDRQMGKKEKIENILSEFVVDSEIKKKLKAIFGFVVGTKEKLASLFNTDDTKSLRLTDDYDETEIEEILGEEYYYFELLNELNSWYTLQNILKGKSYISEAFIEKYEKYNADLKLLKLVYKKYLPTEYNKIFKASIEKYANYNSYANKTSTIEEFYKELEKELKNVPDCEEKFEILKSIKDETFLVRLNSRDNGAVPYQLHKAELIRIIDNQSKYYSTLKENKDKIVSLLTFRIPYYVGPLNSKDNPSRNWSIRFEGKEHDKVYPWNFDEIIDTDASANEFIRRMTNKCTYLPSEDVIPKNSLVYSEFCVLNELNNVRYNGKKLSKEEKQKVIDKLFKEYKTVSKARLKNFLEQENQIKIEEITGLQKENEFASSLTSYIDFSKDILGCVTPQNYNMIEQIIEWVTVFEDKDILARKLKSLKDSNENELLSEEQQKKILKKNYSGWSRLSKKLLTGIWYINEYNQKKNIMDILRETDANLMQIITDKIYGFDKQIQDAGPEVESKKINYKFYEDNVATLAGSPAIKRGIWQTIKVVDELVHILGKEPENIFIEFAREDGEKVRTSSRKAKLQKAYDKFCEENVDQINKELRNRLKNMTEKEITDRVYLYYMQNGKCMYSGKPLDIDQLELYEVDHIIPQSKIKDDSFDNKVLVYSIENQKKTDGYIQGSIIQAQKENWRKLYEAGLISQVKYFNLLNNEETAKRVEGFMKRQLVETRQITKHVTNILQTVYTESSVFAIKATLGHDFREKFDILKIREMNNFHHAHDAYIASIIGNNIIKKYPKMLREFVYKDYIKEFNQRTSGTNENKKNKYGFIISGMGKGYVDNTTGEIISDEMAKVELKRVLDTFDIKDMHITKKLEESTGAFYNQTIYSAKYAREKQSNPINIKENLPAEKYGSYSGEIAAYYTLVQYVQKGKKEYKIVGVPVKESLRISNDKSKLMEFLKTKIECDDLVILKSKLLTNQLLYKDKKPYYLVSSQEIKISKELRLSKEEQLLTYVVLNPDKVSLKLYMKASNIIKKYCEFNCDSIQDEIFNYSEKKKTCIPTDDDKQKFKAAKAELENIVTLKALDIVYDVLTEKIMKEYFKTVGEKLPTLKENYLALDNEEKRKVIKLLLSLTSGCSIDLKPIKGKSSQGRICGQNMNTKWLQDVRFIEQSITGIYEKGYTVNELANSNNI